MKTAIYENKFLSVENILSTPEPLSLFWKFFVDFCPHCFNSTKVYCVIMPQKATKAWREMISFTFPKIINETLRPALNHFPENLSILNIIRLYVIIFVVLLWRSILRYACFSCVSRFYYLSRRVSQIKISFGLRLSRFQLLVWASIYFYGVRAFLGKKISTGNVTLCAVRAIWPDCVSHCVHFQQIRTRMYADFLLCLERIQWLSKPRQRNCFLSPQNNPSNDNKVTQNWRRLTLKTASKLSDGIDNFFIN